MSRSARSGPAPKQSPGAMSAAASPGPGPTVVAAWLIPGAGHALQGQTRKGVVFFVTLFAMFGIGLAFGGRLFPLQMGDPLVFLAAAAQWAMALPRAVSGLAGYGRGDVVASTYEYGNAFLIAGGLLNVLVALDALDLSTGRKPR